MIENDRQYQVTTKALSNFVTALDQLEEDWKEEPNPLWKEIHRNAIESVITELKEQIAEYKKATAGEEQPKPIAP